MDHILRPLKLKYPYMIFVYMDDILIATPNDPALHQQIVHDVLDLLEQESFFLKPQKCTFEQQCVEYLGLLLDGETLHINPSKIAGIAKWPRVLSWFRVGRFEFVYRLTVRVSFPAPRIMCPCYT